MKILVMNGNLVPSGFDDYLARFTGSAIERGHEGERIDLRDLKLRYCMGCWSCWLKTPC
jgi:multimeric flavodoxin WrbA